MSRPLRIQEPGATYHVFSRGDHKQDILPDEERKSYLLTLIRRGAERYRIDVFTYCLMDNHYHLSLRISKENLSQFMHFIGSSYGNYLVRNGWVGHVFQGRYRAIRVDEEEYFLVVNRYIHLNPVEAGIVERPEEYAWSNYDGCINGRNEAWLDESWLADYFGPGLHEARTRYRQFVGGAIGIKVCYPENEVVAQALLGSEDFLRRIKASLREEEWAKGVIGRRELGAIASLGQVHDTVCGHLGIACLGDGDYRNDERYRYACWLLLRIAKECTAASNLDIGEILGGISPNAVAHRFSRMMEFLRRDGEIRARFDADTRRILESIKTERGDEKSPGNAPTNKGLQRGGGSHRNGG